MASVFELANLSLMAYEWNKNSFYKWGRITAHGVPSGKGFYSELYYNPVKKEAVMAIRGTDGDKKDQKDFWSDLQIGIGQVPSQYKSAKIAYDEFKTILRGKKMQSSPFYLTGHSLGGGLASLLMAKETFSKPAFVVTFNSPGMEGPYIDSYSQIPLLDETIGRYNYKCYFDKTPFLHLRATGDPISLKGRHIGKVEDVYVNAWGDGKILGVSRHLAQHSIENMVKTLKTMPWYNKDITIPTTA
ncbi:hypothetical protein [uncultured Desulfobacter sp.]|uniref:lipase family protein n=1 Tax=uncultured Desulfobacter sp. TaxID=240139 RepID=UPI002AA76DDC|nr:hypothetical protein [uncultured Desulfobacter sp.]